MTSLPAESATAAPELRLSLRELFLATACLAVALGAFGLTSATFEIAFALAAVIGLIQECMFLRRTLPKPLTTSDRFALVWRAALSLALASCIAVAIAMPGVWYISVNFTGFGHQLSALLLIVLVLSSSAAKWRDPRPTIDGSRRCRIYGLLAAALIAFVANARAQIYGLTSFALESIERVRPVIFQRVGAYPSHAANNYQFFWAAAVAALGVIASAALFTTLLATASAKKGRACLLCFLALQVTLVAFSYWYYWCEFPRVAPDFAAGGMTTDLWPWSRALVMACVVAAWLAHQAAAARPGVLTHSLPCPPMFHESVICQMFVFAGLLAWLIETAIALSDSWQNKSLPLELADLVNYFLTEPHTYLAVSVALLAIRLARRRSRRDCPPPTIQLPRYHAHEFTLIFAGLILQVATGAPVLGAFAFASSFAPWSH